MVDISKVEFPVISIEQPNLSEACGQFRTGLDTMKSAFFSTGDKLMAKRIAVGDVKIVSTVDFHPQGSIPPMGWPEGEHVDLEKLLHTRYVVNERNPHANRGLQRYFITPSGQMEVVTYTTGESGGKQNDFKWSPAVKATPEMLTVALRGLANQHKALLDFRVAHSVVGVVVPKVANS